MFAVGECLRFPGSLSRPLACPAAHQPLAGACVVSPRDLDAHVGGMGVSAVEQRQREVNAEAERRHQFTAASVRGRAWPDAAQDRVVLCDVAAVL